MKSLNSIQFNQRPSKLPLVPDSRRTQQFDGSRLPRSTSPGSAHQQRPICKSGSCPAQRLRLEIQMDRHHPAVAIHYHTRTDQQPKVIPRSSAQHLFYLEPDLWTYIITGTRRLLISCQIWCAISHRVLWIAPSTGQNMLWDIMELNIYISARVTWHLINEPWSTCTQLSPPPFCCQSFCWHLSYGSVAALKISSHEMIRRNASFQLPCLH